jgi:hypothetical protein
VQKSKLKEQIRMSTKNLVIGIYLARLARFGYVVVAVGMQANN